MYLPMITILISFLGVIICAVANRKVAFIAFIIDNISVIVLTIISFLYCYNNNMFYRYSMGAYSAPFGNEIRFGVLETFLCACLLIVTLLSVLGGKKYLTRDIEEKKIHYYYALVCLIQVAFIALSYTNDIFTGYVFLEITAMASTALLMIKNTGRSTLAAVRYMIFNLLGSSLFLIGVVILYDATGYLSMEYILPKITQMVQDQTKMPLVTIISILLIVGLGIKAGLFPFHQWMPDTYGNATTASQSILSSVVSKGYLILIIKVIYRTIGFENFEQTHMNDVLFILGILGMILGSISAIRQEYINRMIALSSVAQIGYIYMGLGLGTELALLAVVYHMLCHAFTKPLLFTSAEGLIESSNYEKGFKQLKGSGFNDILSGVGFLTGALSMVGFPFVSGFISKYLFAKCAFDVDVLRTVVVLCALIISTLLNAVYYIHTVVTIFTPVDNSQKIVIKKNDILYAIAVVFLMACNVILFFFSSFIIEIIENGIKMLV